METTAKLVVRNNWSGLCSYVAGFSFCAFLWVVTPLGIEAIHLSRSTRTEASHDGKALSELDSWYDGPESWTPGADEFLRDHMSVYYVFSFVNYTIFMCMNVIAWVRYFTLRNWTYAARLITLLLIELVVNMALIWRPTPDGSIQDEPNIIYYLAAPIVTFSDSFASARLAWYWTILIDWWRHGWFCCCCASQRSVRNTVIVNDRIRYGIAAVFLGQSVIYPVITRQMYTDALIFNAVLAYAVYQFVERLYLFVNDPKNAARLQSHHMTERETMLTVGGRSHENGIFTIGDGEDTFDIDNENTFGVNGDESVGVFSNQDSAQQINLTIHSNSGSE